MPAKGAEPLYHELLAEKVVLQAKVEVLSDFITHLEDTIKDCGEEVAILAGKKIVDILADGQCTKQTF